MAVPKAPQATPHTSEFLNMARRRVNLFPVGIEALRGHVGDYLGCTLHRKVGREDLVFKRDSVVMNRELLWCCRRYLTEDTLPTLLA
ncbi:MAG: hypothetical protein ACJ79B_07030 [Gemmatimonadaceae bacterium]